LVLRGHAQDPEEIGRRNAVGTPDSENPAGELPATGEFVTRRAAESERSGSRADVHRDGQREQFGPRHAPAGLCVTVIVCRYRRPVVALGRGDLPSLVTLGSRGSRTRIAQMRVYVCRRARGVPLRVRADVH
jgi:hypothetical protein